METELTLDHDQHGAQTLLPAKPIAFVSGQPFAELPQDLYIPPEALEVFLEMFEGPLDLLLYLIRKHNLDILDISVAQITEQYLQYIELMKEFKIELAGDYLEMAAVLIHIKSRMLLPKAQDEEEEDDPRARLIQKLQEYERFKKAAEQLGELPRLGRDRFVAKAVPPTFERERPHPEVSFEEVMRAFQEVLRRCDLKTAHAIEREALTVRDKMTVILNRLEGDQFANFLSFFDPSEGRLGVVVTFLAILELVKEAVLELVQAESFAPIYVRRAA